MPWFRLYFIENRGMAWGWSSGATDQKMILTLFRFAARCLRTYGISAKLVSRHTARVSSYVALIYAVRWATCSTKHVLRNALFGRKFIRMQPRFFLPAVVPAFCMAGGRYARHRADPIGVPSRVALGRRRKFILQSHLQILPIRPSPSGVITLLIFQKRFLKKLTTEPHPHQL